MSKLFQILMLVLCSVESDAQQPFQLATPLMEYPSVFFKKRTHVSLKFAQPGTVIRYTTNGNAPTAASNRFQKPIRITKCKTVIKAKTFGPGFRPSETVAATIIKDGLPIASVTAPLPDSAHSGSGPRTLFDNEGGIAEGNDKAWLGYRQASVAVTIQLRKTFRVRSVLLHFFQNEDGWIYMPNQIQVFYYDAAQDDFKPFAEAGFATDSTSSNSLVDQMLTTTATARTDRLKIVLNTIPAIPEGRPGSGQQPWLFIDEIKVY